MTIPRNVLTVAPATYPVTKEQVKANLRLAISADDDFIDDLIKVATDWVENETNRALITQTRKQIYDCFPDIFYLRRSPLVSVSSITYTDTEGDSQTVAATVYRADTDSIQARVSEDQDQYWPTDVGDITGAVELTYVAGYGAADDVPELYKHAIKALASYLYRPEIACGKTDEQYMDWIRCLLANEGMTVEYV